MSTQPEKERTRNYDQPPTFLADSFRCPWCDTVAQQEWESLNHEVWLCECSVCEKESLWYHDRLVVPTATTAPLPHPDLPDELRDDYLEARDIAERSPRGAAALLRLVIDKLCPLVGGKGADLNACLADLVKKGLDPRAQKMLDTVRVIGGQAVHPLQMDLRDDRATSQALFQLINFITSEMITKPRWIDEQYAKLPETKRAAIEKRDNKI